MRLNRVPYRPSGCRGCPGIYSGEDVTGPIELTCDAETGLAKCTACALCAKACPSGCISVVGVKKDKRKVVTAYELNFTRCSLCSACVEACPFDAIKHTRMYNQASVTNDYAHIDLVRRLEDQGGKI